MTRSYPKSWESVKRRPALTVHPSVTLERCMELAKAGLLDLESPGLCISCGSEAGGVDPGNSPMRCPVCQQIAIYSAEDLVLRLAP